MTEDEKIKNSREEEEAVSENQKGMDIDIDVDTAETDEAADDAPENEESAQDRTEELTEKLAQANDKYLRLMAEYDNYRKRTTREKTEAYGDATAKCIADILPVLDSFDRAIDAECTDEKFKDGMKMIYSQFLEALKKIGVTEMEALGKEFDPNIHNAIKQESAEGYDTNTVCAVFQKGYMLGDRVIRHAMVAVAE